MFGKSSALAHCLHKVTEPWCPKAAWSSVGPCLRVLLTILENVPKTGFKWLALCLTLCLIRITHSHLPRARSHYSTLCFCDSGVVETPVEDACSKAVLVPFPSPVVCSLFSSPQPFSWLRHQYSFRLESPSFPKETREEGLDPNPKAHINVSDLNTQGTMVGLSETGWQGVFSFIEV